MADPQPAPKRPLLRRLGPAGFLTLLAIFLPPVGLALMIGFLTTLAPWLKSHGAWGIALYISSYWLLGGLYFLPTYSYSILGGWAFGLAIGYPAAMTAIVGAALVGYGLARRASGTRVLQVIAEKPKWQAIYNALLGAGFRRSLFIVTLLRLPPNSPFAIGNVVFASTRVPLVPFILGTLIGLAPRTAVVVYTAAHMQSIDLSEPDRTQQIAFLVVSLVLSIIAIVVIGHFAKRALARLTEPAPGGLPVVPMSPPDSDDSNGPGA